ncbi:hypothetical protein ABT150_13750 [Streptomyces mirabilis]|uniref:hypothetical protein n=1 Tax=Streptomyces mirabilis TaxID=68239 RepID=UPI0033296AAE
MYGACRLRLASVPAGRPGGKLSEGTERAPAAFPGVRKPALYGLYDWTSDGYAYRAELSAFVDETLLSPDLVLRDELDLPDALFETIRMNLSAIAATPTDRIAVRHEWISRAVPEYTGHPAPRITEWACAHGDFHAANLTTGPTIRDWEGWGTAPRGDTTPQAILNVDQMPSKGIRRR